MQKLLEDERSKIPKESAFPPAKFPDCVQFCMAPWCGEPRVTSLPSMSHGVCPNGCFPHSRHTQWSEHHAPDLLEDMVMGQDQRNSCSEVASIGTTFED